MVGTEGHAKRAAGQWPGRWVHGALASAAITLAAGCTFYTDTINGEPDAHILKTTSGPHHINQIVTLSAIDSRDPNDPANELTARWIVHECSDELGLDCTVEVDDQNLSVFLPYELEVDKRLSYRVTLEVADQRGATDYDTLVVEVDNRDPSLSLDPQGCQGCGAYTLGTWIDVLAVAEDLDGDAVDLAWQLFAPDASVSSARQFDAVADYPVPAYRLVPDVVGLWTVRVTATDEGGGQTVVDAALLVEPDRPPCIASIEPMVPGATYVLDAGEQPRRFAALAVSDDLDPFPPLVDPGAFHGEVTFRWFIASPDTGGVFTEITDHLLADYIFDPSAFAPGDQISLRVEVADRVARSVSCPVGDAVCSAEGDSCLQRVSWGVEIR